MNKKCLRNKDKKIYKFTDLHIDRSETKAKECYTCSDNFSTASTAEEVSRKGHLQAIKDKSRSIPTPKPKFTQVALRAPRPAITLPKGQVVTPALPAECFTSPMLQLKLEKQDQQADSRDITFVNSQVDLNGAVEHQAQDHRKLQLKAYEFIINLQEKQLKMLSLQRLPKNSDQVQKPNLGIGEVLGMISANNPSLLDQQADLVFYVRSWLSPSMIGALETHQRTLVGPPEQPNQFRPQQLIRFLNHKPPYDDKSHNVAQRNRFKTRKTFKKQVSKRTSENYYSVFKLIQEKIKEFKGIVNYKLKTEHLTYQRHCIDLNQLSLHQVHKQAQMRHDASMPSQALVPFLSKGLDSLSNSCSRPEINLKRKRSESLPSQEDSYSRYNDYKTKAAKDMLNQILHAQSQQRPEGSGQESKSTTEGVKVNSQVPRGVCASSADDSDILKSLGATGGRVEEPLYLSKNDRSDQVNELQQLFDEPESPHNFRPQNFNRDSARPNYVKKKV